jgi:flagellar protein FlbT
LLVENEVPVLRQSDILSPRAVRTACDQIYMALQLAYIDPSPTAGHLQNLGILAAEVGGAAPSLQPILDEIHRLAEAGRLYQAIKKAQVLRHRERVMIGDVS